MHALSFVPPSQALRKFPFMASISFSFFFFFFLMAGPPPRSTLFPYPPLFRSAGGLNAGAEAAIAAGAERLLLLNNDTVLAPDALGRLAAALDVRPRVGIAGPRLMDLREPARDRKSTRLNSSHLVISYAVFCLK